MIGMVSHDAGGAEILSSFASRQPRAYIYALGGPARRIFERKLGPVDNVPLEHAMRHSESILCGTSWQSSLEVDAIVMAREWGKRSVAFLDHWSNYRERFTRGGSVHLPDEIWVGDDVAAAMAEASFPGLPIALVPNPYLEDVQRELRAVSAVRPPSPAGIAVLYVCEPVAAHAQMMFGNERHFGYIEDDALRFFLENTRVLGQPVHRIVIRPHPAEPRDKYSWVRGEFDLPIEVGGDRTLIQEIADSDVVVGCESMAMVVALLASKRVLSCIPPNGKACQLPHAQIEHLQDLVR